MERFQASKQVSNDLESAHASRLAAHFVMLHFLHVLSTVG